VHFKLIVVVVEDADTDAIVRAARAAGATGSTVLSQARGEGYQQQRAFFGLDVGGQRDVILFLVEEHLSRSILEAVGIAGGFDTTPGSGIAFQLNVEDAVGVLTQERVLHARVEEEL
jgi:nitrogen regulatory protein PII